MKKLLSLPILALAFAVHAQPIQRGTISTNAALQNALASGSIYVSAAYGNDTNASPGPFATLTKAQTVATSGQTIQVLDGTFTETGLGKSNVAWSIAKGVTLDGGASGVFTLGTNGNLFVSGHAVFTNIIVTVTDATNLFSLIQCETFWPGTSGSINLFSGQSNVVTLSSEYGVAATGGSFLNVNSSGSASNSFFRLNVKSDAELYGQAANTTLGMSNQAVNVFARKWNMTGNGALNKNVTVRQFGGEFSRNGRSITTVGPMIVFHGVSITSSNADGAAAMWGAVKGSYYVEQP